MGRMIAIMACFWGVFMVSLFVVTLNNMLIYSMSEENAYNLLRRLEFKEKIKEKALGVLNKAFKTKLARNSLNRNNNA